MPRPTIPTLEPFLGDHTVTKARLLAVSTDVHSGHVAVFLDGVPHILLENRDALDLANMIKTAALTPAQAALESGDEVSASLTVID